MADSIKWIKLSIGFFNDEKIRLIRSMPEADFVINVWILLLTLAGKTNDSGLIYMERNVPYTPDMIGTLLGKTPDQAKYALNIILKFKMIELCDDGLISVTNWEKHQNMESMDKVKDQARLRKAKQREKEKLAIQQFTIDSSHVLERDCHVTVTQQKEERRKKKEERRKEKEDNIKGGSSSVFDLIVKSFNEICISLPKVTMLTDTRKSKLQTRIDEIGSTEKFDELFQIVESTPFLIGTNEKGWKASFDWLIENQNNWVKVMEGHYKNTIKHNISPDKTNKHEKAITALRECSGTTTIDF